MGNEIAIILLGPTSKLALSSIAEAAPDSKIIHVITNKKDSAGVAETCVCSCDHGMTLFERAIEIGKSAKQRFLYIMHGFSVLNCEILKEKFLGEIHGYANSFSNYLAHEEVFGRTQKDVRLVEHLFSFDPILSGKTIIPIVNIFIDLNNLKQFNYKSPYDLVLGEYSMGNIVNHIPVPTFSVCNDPYESINSEIRNKYGKLYL